MEERTKINQVDLVAADALAGVVAGVGTAIAIITQSNHSRGVAFGSGAIVGMGTTLLLSAMRPKLSESEHGRLTYRAGLVTGLVTGTAIGVGLG